MSRGAATTTSSAFTRSVRVSVDVDAGADRIWELLTDAAAFPRWNSTVTSITGPIAKGRKLAIKVPISPRTFTPTVTEFEPPRRMVWRDGRAPMFRGERVYELAPQSDGRTRFTMTETFSGVMLPLIGRTLPDFAPVFERYAADLKVEAERTTVKGA
jgi:hypothetical protein